MAEATNYFQDLFDKIAGIIPADYSFQLKSEVCHLNLTRFAQNWINQTISTDVIHTIIVIQNNNHESKVYLSTNDEATVLDTVRSALEVLPEQSGYTLKMDGSSEKIDEIGFVAQTASVSAEMRAQMAEKVIQTGQAGGCETSGFVSTEVREQYLYNTLGKRSYSRTTAADVRCICKCGSGSGYAADCNMDFSKLDWQSVAEDAARIAVASDGHEYLPADDYDVIFQPYAVTDLLAIFGKLAFSAGQVQSGNSLLSGNIGKQITGANVSIYDDATSPETLCIPADSQGMVRKPVKIIENGVAVGYVHNRETAEKEGVESTGHSVLAMKDEPYAQNLFLEAGDASLDDMIASIDKGLLVTRLNYINPIHRKKTIITGMTRDGVFLIEHGKIVKPVHDLRYTICVADVFSHIEMIGKDRKLCQTNLEGGGAVCYVPAVKISNFHFTGVSE